MTKRDYCTMLQLIMAGWFSMGITNSAADQSATGSLTGIVLDQESGQGLSGVHVLVELIALNGEATRSKGTATDQTGRFMITGLALGRYVVRATMIGYETHIQTGIEIQSGRTTELDTIVLKQNTFLLEEIVVSPGRFSIMGTDDLSKQILSSEDLKNMSWAEDITRAVARLPGISSSDYSSKFTIRGGESDEVLIALDGMELYEPFHQRDFSGGLFSIVDIETIEGIHLMTGGFPADYGNRLSGVFNMRTKRIEAGERHMSVGLSLMNARIYSDASFADGRGSFVFSARRGMLDLLFKAIPAAEEATIDQGSVPTYWDTMAKIAYQWKPKHHISLHVLGSGDRTTIEDIEGDNFDKNDTKYSNSYAWATLSSALSSTLFVRTMAYGGLISHDRLGSFNKYEPSDKGFFNLTDIRDYSLLGLKQDWSWQKSSRMFWTGGFDVKQLDATYSYSSQLSELRVDQDKVIYQYDKTNEQELSPSGQQVGLYATGKFMIAPKLVLESGLRFDHTSYSGDNVLSPRIGLAYAISPRTTARGAWGSYYQSQFINNLDVNNGNVDFNPAELATHYVVGLEHNFVNGIQFRMEAYHKDLSNYSPIWQNLRDHLEVFPEARNDNARILRNGALSQGVEFFLKRDVGSKISWWISYALAKAEDDIKEIQYDGQLSTRTGKVARLNNQRHTVYADLNYRPGSTWHLNLSWTYYVGWPRTNYTYEYQSLDNGDLHFYAVHDEYNAVEYPAFHRMDLRINRRFSVAKGQLTAFLHLINLYAHENLKKFDLDTRNDNEEFSLDTEGNYVPFRDDKLWFGFTPVIGVSWAI